MPVLWLGHTLGAQENLCGLTLPITLDAGAGFDSYLWNTGETTQSIEISSYGNYSVEGISICGNSTGNVDVEGYDYFPPLNFGGTFTDCDALFPVTLDAGEGFDSYLWSTGETTQTIEVNVVDSYSVNLTNNCGTGTYTVDLDSEITPPGITFPDDVSLCNASFPITLDAIGPFDTYLWNTGETTSSILVTGPGVYSVEIENSCGTGGDEIEFFSLGDPPSINIDDMALCNTDFPVTLNAGTGFDSYLWSTGETTQTIEVNSSASISVEISNQCGSASDLIEITSLNDSQTILTLISGTREKLLKPYKHRLQVIIL